MNYNPKNNRSQQFINRESPVGADLCVCPNKEKSHQSTMGEHIGSPLHHSIKQNVGAVPRA